MWRKKKWDVSHFIALQFNGMKNDSPEKSSLHILLSGEDHEIISRALDPPGAGASYVCGMPFFSRQEGTAISSCHKRYLHLQRVIAEQLQLPTDNFQAPSLQ